MVDNLEVIINYWNDVGIIKVTDINSDSFVGRAIGFFNGFFILSTIEGGRTWISTDNIVSVKEMGIVVREDEVSTPH